MGLTYCLQCGVELEDDAEQESGRCGVCDEIIDRLEAAVNIKRQAERVIEECRRELNKRELQVEEAEGQRAG